MALRKRNTPLPYQVYWNNPVTGTRESKSFSTKPAAEKFDAEIKYRLKYEKQSFAPEAYQPEQNSLTLEHLYILYLRDKNFSEHDLARQLSHMKPIMELLGGQAVKDISKQHLMNTLSALRSSKISDTTVRNRMAMLRAVLNWGYEKELTPHIPFVRLPKPSTVPVPPLSVTEVQTILEKAAPHLRRVIVLGFNLGVRIGQSELLKLRWDTFDLEIGLVRAPSAKRQQGAWREIIIKDSLLPILKQWQDEDRSINCQWVINYKGRQITRISTSWQSALKKAGITRRIRPYDLRHAFATHALAEGADIKAVAELMGHTTPTMIYHHYQHVLNKQRRAAVEAIPDLAINQLTQ